MAVYVDNPRIVLGRMKMCHMAADSLDELHAMAERLNVRRHFQNRERAPHYDICMRNRREAVLAGALEVSTRELLEKAGVCL